MFPLLICIKIFLISGNISVFTIETFRHRQMKSLSNLKKVSHRQMKSSPNLIKIGYRQISPSLKFLRIRYIYEIDTLPIVM